MALKNPNIAKANPSAQANASFINALYQEQYGRAATKAEIDKFVGKSVKDASNLILGQANSPFTASTTPKAVTPAPVAAQTPQTPAQPLQTPFQEALAQVTDPALRDVLVQMDNNLQRLTQNGQVVNPSIDITPEKAAEFMAQAEKEINPYYQTQLRMARQNFLTTLNYDKNDILNFERNVERQYQQGLRDNATSAADRGFAQSGIRQRELNDLQYNTQEQLTQSRENFNRREQELANAYTREYGNVLGEQVPQGLGYSSIQQNPTVTDTGISYQGAERPLYELSPDLYQSLIGQQEFNRRTQTQTRASELENAFRQQQALNQQRTITL